ncbi:uncharacterized protein JCM6883_000994 [Sporobolomyces salmoneus]|uniref:uncharacterized protein n=1 Tax=Sporobolomyces salmoneus TaxID=183962 RepID=UPI00316C672B
MYNNSPRLNHSGLRLPPRSDPSASPSISPTSTTPHVFPPSSSASTPYDHHSTSTSSYVPSQPSSSTARFHEALAARPFTTRHASNISASSIDSNAGYDPLDTTSPMGDRAFDTMQRELGTPTAHQGLGLSEATLSSGLRAMPREMGRLYEEPEEFQEIGRARSATGTRNFSDGTTRGQHGSGGGGNSSQELAGFDNSMSFLLSPPTSYENSTASARHLAAAAASEGSKAIPRTSRVFPAPLLLKGGGSNPSSPIFTNTTPLSIPRRPSASAGGGGAGSQSSPSLGQYQRGNWGSTSVSRSEREREGSMGPPVSASMNSTDNSRSSLPYQRHRSQQSSTSSISQGSYLPYNNSYSYTMSGTRHQNNTSSSASTSSPALGNTPSYPVPSSSSSSLSTMGPPLVPQPSIAQTTSLASTSSSSDPPISSQALLLHIHSLRSASSPMALSQSQGPLPRSPASLLAQQQSHQRIRSAGSTTEPDSTPTGLAPEKSPSRPGSAPRLDTVDLSHKRIAEVPIEVVDELKNEVEKLALGYNLLKDLPSYFVGFGSRLKYLNVRVNLLTTFPAVLCEMPSIEILDISRNKIRKLPQNPGTLVNLKVFSIAKNRVKRLPTWFTSMSHLKVLKLDHNPLEWPPKEVTTFQTPGSVGGAPLSKQEEADEMQRWLPALMRWMRENRDKEIDREREREKEKRRKPSNPPELPIEDERLPQTLEDASRRAGMPRTESGGRLRNSPSLPSLESFPRPRLRSHNTDQVISTLDALETDPSARHSRNASHSLMQSLEPAPRNGLKSKKSLPDLRQSHADILAERRNGSTIEREENRITPALPTLDKLKAERPPFLHSVTAKASLPTQSHPVHNGDSLSTFLSTPVPLPRVAAPIVRSESARPIPRSVPVATTSKSLPPLDPPKPSFTTSLEPPKREEAGRTTPTEFERNSGAYFRRQSMLPASTIAKAVPSALLEFAEAIRGILFSLSQIYSALRQFVVFASQDRLPATIARLMGSADQATNSLINALDRFDSQSRRGLPPQRIVRQVFTTCRDNVVTFGQLVAALQPQLGVLTATADVRYTRTLLLMLYGSMGEIANSWSAVVPLFPPLDRDPASCSSTTVVLQPPTPSPTLERSVSTTSTTSNGTGGGGGGARLTRKRSVTRRHAGSFSVEDVQIGAVLPPAEIPPVPAIPPSTSLDDLGISEQQTAANSATVRARPTAPSLPKSSSASSFSSNKGRLPPTGSLPLPPVMHYQDMVQSAFDQPLTPGGTGLFERLPSVAPEMPPRSNSSSFHTTNASNPSTPMPTSSSSHNLGIPLPPASTPSSAYNPHRESRPVSTLNADEMFVDQADSTIQIALDVYGMLLDSFDDPNAPTSAGAIGRKRARELTELCKNGNDTTVRLKRGVERVRGGDGRGKLKFTSNDARRLGDASFDFVQTVIKFARAVKATSTEVSFAPQVREGVGQLTLATREFAKLLSQNQTSFRPTEQTSQPSRSQVSQSHKASTGSNGVSNGGGGGGREGGEVKVRDYAMM